MADGFTQRAAPASFTAKRARELFTYDPQTGVICWRVAKRGRQGAVRMKPGDLAGAINGSGYRQIKIDGRYQQAHRLAWLMVTGKFPPHQIDHVNGDRADNRWCNLRAATRSQNCYNRGKRADNRSGYKGVCFNKKSRKWQANISVAGRFTYLGMFDTAEAAHAAYLAAAQEHHGEFANGGSNG